MPGKKKAIHVVADKKGGWNTKKDNAKRASKHFDTKDEAGKAAKDQGQREKTEVITHKKNGRIQRRESYGNDPYPPKDKK